VDGNIAAGHVAKHQIRKRAANVHANGSHHYLRFRRIVLRKRYGTMDA
jgi:hypothetical protein